LKSLANILAMQKLKLKLTKSEIEWLSAWLRVVVERTPVESLELESMVASECYARLLSKFTFIAPGTLNLKLTEALALKRTLQGWHFTTDYDDLMCYTIYDKINRKCLIP